MDDPLSSLTIDTFRDRVGETFRDRDAGVAFELREVEDFSEAAGNVALDARTPFSLYFMAPAELVLPQGIRPLVHDELGELDIFLVPVAREPEGIRYQAVFT